MRPSSTIHIEMEHAYVHSLPVSAFSDLLNNLAKKTKTYRTILVLDSFKQVLVKS